MMDKLLLVGLVCLVLVQVSSAFEGADKCAEGNGQCVDPTTCPCHFGKFKKYECDEANPSYRCCIPRAKTDLNTWEPCIDMEDCEPNHGRCRRPENCACHNGAYTADYYCRGGKTSCCVPNNPEDLPFKSQWHPCRTPSDPTKIERIDLVQRLADNIRKGKKVSPRQVLGLKKGEDVDSSQQLSTSSNTTKTKYQFTYKGIPVMGQAVVLETDANGDYTGDVSGSLVGGLKTALPSIKPTFNESEALNMAAEQEGDDLSQIDLAVSSDVQLQIYIDDDEKPHLVYQLSYNVENDEKVGRPFFIIDAISGEVLASWQGVSGTHTGLRAYILEFLRRLFNWRFPSTGPNFSGGVGGNLKTGQYWYGGERPQLDVRSDIFRQECFTENDDVLTVHMHNGYYGNDVAHKFDCSKGIQDSVNGAYSPMNDAHFHSSEVVSMYNDWYGQNPLPFKLVTRAHFRYNYENAFWNGKTITLGDGAFTFYPLVSLDVISHEIAHGFTENNSNLRYSGQSGGINEAFSDMAGKAAEFYSSAYPSNDWMLGAELGKSIPALRYMDTPSRDGRSIDHASRYYSGMDVHHSSGVYNRAFYLLATTPGWDVHCAFNVFVRANQLYWGPFDGYNRAACGVIRATYDLGYGHLVNHVISALSRVGVACS